MHFNRPQSDVEPARHHLIAEPVHQAAKHFVFARRERPDLVRSCLALIRDHCPLRQLYKCVLQNRNQLHIVKRLLEERSEEHTSELQSLMRISYAVFCLKTKTTKRNK